MKPALILKWTDVLMQLALIIFFSIEGRDINDFLLLCAVVLLWQLTSSIIHFFFKADWKMNGGRKGWILAFCIFFFLILGYAPLVIFLGPMLIIIYLAMSIGELKDIFSEGKHINQIQPH